jgi:5-formyltetrahydrofolate cyclo-ligase
MVAYNLKNSAERKTALRSHHREIARRVSMQPELVQRIVQNLEKVLTARMKVAVYMPLSDELDIQSGLAKSLGTYELCYPRVQGEALEFYQFVKNEKVFLKNAMGVKEPHPAYSVRVPLVQIDAVIVPGLAFDRKGCRLGRGKGFYDRGLANYKGVKVAACAKAQLTSEDLPAEPHDVFMDLIVTEDFILKLIAN